jgi:hypothetical protein
MQLLDTVEIKKIENRLVTAEIKNESLSVDLIDHICCMIEERLDLGYTLEKAEEDVFTKMGVVQLKSIELETKKLTQNKFIMKKRTKIIGIIALLVTLTGFMFKMLHLPGAGILWGSGILLGALGFFLLVLVDRFSYEKSNSKRAIVFVGYLGSALLLIGLGFALLNWPLSTYLAEGGGLILLVYFVVTNSTSYTNESLN